MDPNPPTQPVVVVAHRGLWAGRAPENSSDAFVAASAHALPSECDVWASADGEAIVHHDRDVSRTTFGRGAVADLSAADIQRLRLRPPTGRRTGTGPSAFGPPPLLAAVAGQVSVVEIKPVDSPALVRRVVSLMRGRTWVLQSFDPRNIEHALACDASLRVALLVDDRRAIDVAVSRGWAAHVDHKLLDDGLAARARRGGIALGAWTVNASDEIERALRWGPAILISDEPLLARQVVDQCGMKWCDAL